MNDPLQSRIAGFQTLAQQLAAFNKQRGEKFSRGPLPDDRLPIPHTMVGADLPDTPPRE